MSYNSHYKYMSIPTALEIYLSTESFHGITAEDEYEVNQISENEFNIASISNDPLEAFDFDLRIYIDPVLCQITYDVYRSFYGDTGKIIVDDISYDHVLAY